MSCVNYLQEYMRFGLDVRDEDVFWNMSAPGRAYGLFYALIGPLLVGKATLFFNAPFDAQAVYRMLQKYGVTNFASAPTAYRALRAAGVPAGLRGGHPRRGRHCLRSWSSRTRSMLIRSVQPSRTKAAAASCEVQRSHCPSVLRSSLVGRRIRGRFMEVLYTRSMKRLQSMIEEDLNRGLERLARESGQSKAALIRQFVRERVHPPLSADPLGRMIRADDFEPAPVDDVVYG